MKRCLIGILALGSLGGCGGEGSLTLRLLRAGFDKPYDGVQQLQLRALGSSFEEVERIEAEASGDGNLELGLLGSGQRRLEVLGLGTGGAMLARGQSRLLQLESEQTIEEVVPFSTLKVAVALPASQAVAPTITVDGSLAEWQASPSLVLDQRHLVSKASATAADLFVEVFLAWDAVGRLAFALAVQDDCPSLRKDLPAGSCGTAVAPERVYLGFDGADDGGASYGSGDLWVEITATSLAVHQGTATPGQLAVVMAPRSDLKGWVLEGTIQPAALGRSGLTDKDRVGFDITVVDADPSDSQPTVLRWSGGLGPPNVPTVPDAMGTIGMGTLSGP